MQRYLLFEVSMALVLCLLFHCQRYTMYTAMLALDFLSLAHFALDNAPQGLLCELVAHTSLLRLRRSLSCPLAPGPPGLVACSL